MPQYGTFDMPSFLAYPPIKSVEETPGIVGLFCYAVEPYEPGYACLIKRQGGSAGIIVGDWQGQAAASETVLRDKVPILLKLMGQVGLDQAQFFFSQTDRLVDACVSLNKFLGPGMVRDLFTKLMPVQQVIAVDTMGDDKVRELAQAHPGAILKPSRFRHYELGGVAVPLYAHV